MYRSRPVIGQLVAFGQIVTIAVGSIASSAYARIHLPKEILPSVLQDTLVVALFATISLILSNLLAPYKREEASDRPLPWIIIFYYPLYLVLLCPSLLLQKMQNLFISETDSKAQKEEQFRQIVETETESGTIEEEEREMIEGIFEFGDTTVKEVMVPRIDMVCAELSDSQDELLDMIQQGRHSRIPVYKERVDHIEGVVYAKDLLEILRKEDSWTITDIMREPYFAPENKKIDELLREFKNNKVHMAIVINEFGGTSGLVTLEDLIEEIVGEIQDEYDEEEQLFHWHEEGLVLVADARIDIDDLNILLNVELPMDGYETLGGFIYNHLGHVPDPKETFRHENLVMSIQGVVGQRITKVHIVKQEPDKADQKSKEEIA
jgi:putative hemolysin